MIKNPYSVDVANVGDSFRNSLLQTAVLQVRSSDYGLGLSVRVMVRAMVRVMG
jgi:hypothetical protein